MEALAYYDGKIGTLEELTVPFNDRVHFSVTVYTTPLSAQTAKST